jgi:adenylate cyclase
MESLAGWLWRRWRRHSRVVFFVVAAVVLGVAVLGMAVVVVSYFFALSLREFLLVLAVGWAFNCFGLAVGISSSADGRVIAAWGRGEEDDAERAWSATISATRTLATRCVLWQVPPQMVVTGGLIARYGHLTTTGVVAVELAIVVVLAIGWMAGAVGFHLLLVPMLLEVATALGAEPPNASGGVSLRVRLMWSFSMVVCLAAVVGGVGVLAAHTRSAQFALALFLGAAFAVYASSVLHYAVIQPTLGPVRDLTAAVRRVRVGDLDHRVPVTSGDEFGELAIAFNEMQAGLREREALHAAFESYVDPGLARRLLESGSSMFEGEELDVTVMFADVRSFTTYSEAVTPAEAVRLLNRLFDVMVPVIHEHGGHANHYLGDGLLAAFGAPQPLVAHADAAVAAAIEIQQRVRAALGDDLRLGIGVNTGPVIAGTVGGGGRLEFTVIGDTVNAAARVEALTKETGDWILITDATRLALSAPRPRSTKRGDFELRGRTNKVALHAINPFPRPARASTRS